MNYKYEAVYVSLQLLFPCRFVVWSKSMSELGNLDLVRDVYTNR